MTFNNFDIFKCERHDFSTSDIKLWDKHCAEVPHQYDLHDDCACGCGTEIHVMPEQTLDPSARRIPRGQMDEGCMARLKSAEKIKEAGEIHREKEKKHES